MSLSQLPVSFLQRDEGFRIGYTIVGQGLANSSRPMVLVNGMGGIYEDWETLANELGKSRRVLLYDHRGMGQSAFPASAANIDITMSNMAQDLLDLILHIGWKEVDLLGWSMGGLVVQQLLLDNKFEGSFRIPHVIMAATCGKLPDGEPDALPSMGAMIGAAQQYGGDRAASTYRDNLKFGVEKYFDAEFVKENDGIFQRWIDYFTAGTRRVEIVGAQAKAGVGIDYRPDVLKYPASTRIFVLHGSKDRIVYPYESDYLVLSQTTKLPLGTGANEVPNLDFGHAWWEYFTPQTWANVLSKFVDDRGVQVTSHR